MRIIIKSIGHKMASWIEAAYQDYLKRIPNEFQISLVEIPSEHRTNESIDRKREREGERLLEKIPKEAYIIALDVLGKSLSTPQFAEKLERWQMNHPSVYFLIGGSDGLSPGCLERANERWSLSSLTFPHGLVRVILVEQLYRSISILMHHPYHRY